MHQEIKKRVAIFMSAPHRELQHLFGSRAQNKEHRSITFTSNSRCLSAAVPFLVIWNFDALFSTFFSFLFFYLIRQLLIDFMSPGGPCHA